MPYILHPSENLRAHFRGWQGNNPMQASFLFVGLDANYEANIDNSLPEIFGYLDDGIQWCQGNDEGVHHPFMLHHYHGSGKRYHKKFTEIGFTVERAHCFSFVELLHVPTMGRSNLKLPDLSINHLAELNNTFDAGIAKYIVVSSKVTKLMRQSGIFPRLNPYPLPNDLHLKVLREENDQIIYEMYHLSCYGWQLPILNMQIAQLREIVQNFINC